MKKLYIAMIAFVLYGGLLFAQVQPSGEDKDLEILKLRLALKKERIEKLEAQYALEKREYMELLARYQVKMGERGEEKESEDRKADEGVKSK